MNPILKFYYGSLDEIDGTLVCSYCASISSSGEYNRKSRILRWKCIECDKLNVVENFEA